jgi:hypothetical protein
MNEDLTPAEMLMSEIALTLEALTEDALHKVVQPPRGSIQEVGHYRALGDKLKRKELDALRTLLDELAYNVAAAIFATLDNSIESDLPNFPKFTLVNQDTGQPVAESLHQAFTGLWEEDDGTEGEE